MVKKKLSNATFRALKHISAAIRREFNTSKQNLGNTTPNFSKHDTAKLDILIVKIFAQRSL